MGSLAERVAGPFIAAAKRHRTIRFL
jgi:hypothetical protein